MKHQQIIKDIITLDIYWSDRSSHAPRCEQYAQSKGERLTQSLRSFFTHYSHEIVLPNTVSEIRCSITFCGKKKIKKLNREYRQKDAVTDVLSFPIHEDLRVGECAVSDFTDIIDLGDIVICLEKAQVQAKQFGISFEDELTHLIIHGFLHLCGYDHEISTEEEIMMEEREEYMVKQF